MSAALPFRWRWRVWSLVFTLPPLLHVVSLHRVASRMAASGKSRPLPPIAPLVAEVDFWLTRLPWPWRSTCLKSSVILYALLRPAGVDIELRIGVKRQADRSFEAHAWLMHEGAPYLERPTSPLESFQIIARFPEVGPAQP